MILLAYLTTRNDAWEDAHIRLLAFHLDRDNKEMMDMLKETLDEFRISAEPRIILALEAEDLVRTSKDADLTFIPMSLSEGQPVLPGKILPKNILPLLGTVAMVMAAQKIDLDSAPEEGKAGELARLFDELKHAEKRVQTAEKGAYQAAKLAADFLEKADEAPLSDPDMAGHLREALALRDKSEEAKKKLLKERAKLMDISQRAEEKGLPIEKENKPDGSN